MTKNVYIQNLNTLNIYCFLPLWLNKNAHFKFFVLLLSKLLIAILLKHISCFNRDEPNKVKCNKTSLKQISSRMDKIAGLVEMLYKDSNYHRILSLDKLFDWKKINRKISTLGWVFVVQIGPNQMTRFDLPINQIQILTSFCPKCLHFQQIIVIFALFLVVLCHFYILSMIQHVFWHLNLKVD